MSNRRVRRERDSGRGDDNTTRDSDVRTMQYQVKSRSSVSEVDVPAVVSLKE